VPITAAIALGSNVGDRGAHIAFALEALGRLPGTRMLAKSTIIETAPVGPGPQGPYLNAAAVLETILPPHELLSHLLAIERQRGRERSAVRRWGPRTLDLDLLLYGDQTIDEEGLCVPHPRLQERLFVLAPLAEILPDAVVPGLNRTVAQLLSQIEGATGC
jgi:2-amino-4-hydroxy-6-hydroxymethyldihydropteridine diphosphokinase